MEGKTLKLLLAEKSSRYWLKMGTVKKGELLLVFDTTIARNESENYKKLIALEKKSLEGFQNTAHQTRGRTEAQDTERNTQRI